MSLFSSHLLLSTHKVWEELSLCHQKQNTASLNSSLPPFYKPPIFVPPCFFAAVRKEKKKRKKKFVVMAETVHRKACDRCHAQKLSCKRYNDEACERCVRLKTECKSSPSLRYRKNQQQLAESQQQQQQQRQQFVDNGTTSSLTATSSGRRSPKRRRTDSQEDPSLVSPDAGTCPLPLCFIALLFLLSWMQPTHSRVKEKQRCQ